MVPNGVQKERRKTDVTHWFCFFVPFHSVYDANQQICVYHMRQSGSWRKKKQGFGKHNLISVLFKFVVYVARRISADTCVVFCVCYFLLLTKICVGGEMRISFVFIFLHIQVMLLLLPMYRYLCAMGPMWTTKSSTCIVNMFVCSLLSSMFCSIVYFPCVCACICLRFSVPSQYILCESSIFRFKKKSQQQNESKSIETTCGRHDIEKNENTTQGYMPWEIQTMHETKFS